MKRSPSPDVPNAVDSRPVRMHSPTLKVLASASPEFERASRQSFSESGYTQYKPYWDVWEDKQCLQKCFVVVR